MLISQEFFDKSVITQLELDLSSTEANYLKEEFLDNFSSKYIMPKEYWSLKLELANYFWSISEEQFCFNLCNSFVLKGIYHFYYDRKYEEYTSDGFYRKILHLPIYKFGLIHPSDFQDYIKNALLYPNKHLEKFYKKYDENATSPLPADLLKRHNEMKELYQRIKASENDLEKWFSLLCEASDRKFIIHNIEYRIGGDLLNKRLWKIYIKYLKDENDFHGLFHLYSKYCRFFLDDFEMKGEYETEVKKHGKKFSVAWAEPFEFESSECWDDVYDREKNANPNSAYISSLSQCIAKYIKIGFQKLTYNELKFFIGSGNVELLEMFDSKITDGNYGNVTLEDILKLVPKIRYFQMTEIECTSKTAEILSNFNFQNKIKRLQLIELYGAPLNVQAFKEFCIKNMDKTFGMTLDFQEGSVTDEFCLSFKEAMEDKKYFFEKSIHRMDIGIGIEW
uniref:Uncharacterized protein n=1 Tax=Panagrolaimus davidi TaxID=227884 RepID=A0A914PM92_9BILA